MAPFKLDTWPWIVDDNSLKHGKNNWHPGRNRGLGFFDVLKCVWSGLVAPAWELDALLPSRLGNTQANRVRPRIPKLMCSVGMAMYVETCLVAFQSMHQLHPRIAITAGQRWPAQRPARWEFHFQKSGPRLKGAEDVRLEQARNTQGIPRKEVLQCCRMQPKERASLFIGDESLGC